MGIDPEGMVYALKEAWRVLRPRGLMIDLRPICLDASLDILYKEGKETARIVDMSPEIDLEIAADQAIEKVLEDGCYKELAAERFDIAYYWNTVKGMMADIRNRWIEDVIIEESVIQRAYTLFGRYRSHNKVRLLIQMRLASYEKRI
jgi:hypothetical protein